MTRRKRLQRVQRQQLRPAPGVAATCAREWSARMRLAAGQSPLAPSLLLLLPSPPPQLQLLLFWICPPPPS